MEEINSPKKIEETGDVQESIANFVNKLAELILPEEKCFKFTKVGLDTDSFELTKNIISNFKEVCQTPDDNKKLLLLELFECYFLDDKSFKRIELDDISDFSDMMENYKNFWNIWLKFKNEKFNRTEEAKSFVRLLSKIPNLDAFFANIGMRLLMKKGYTLENLLKYAIYALVYKKKFYYNIKNLIQKTKGLDYLSTANKLKSLIDKINFEDDLNNMQLIFQNNSFELVSVDIDIILNDMEVQESKFPKSLKKRINKYINKGNEQIKKENVEIMKKEKEQNENENENKQDEQKQNERDQNEQEIDNIKSSEKENKERNKIILPVKRIENTINKNIEDNKINELILKIELMQKTLDENKLAQEKKNTELKNTNSELQKEIVKLKDELNNKNEENEEIKQEYKVNIKELKTEIKNIKNVMKLKIQKIENNEAKIKNLEKSNKEITSILDSIKN